MASHRVRYTPFPSSWLRPGQHHRPKSGCAARCAESGRMHQSVLRPGQRHSRGPARLGATTRLSTTGGCRGDHRAQPHDPLAHALAPSRKEIRGQRHRADLVAREHRYLNGNGSLLLVYHGCYRSDGTGLKAERAAAGRQAARARGRTGGRPRTDPAKLEQARILYDSSEKTASEICQALGIGRRTFFSYLAKAKHQVSGEPVVR